MEEQLKRIADALDKQNAGIDEIYHQLIEISRLINKAISLISCEDEASNRRIH